MAMVIFTVFLIIQLFLLCYSALSIFTIHLTLFQKTIEISQLPTVYNQIIKKVRSLRHRNIRKLLSSDFTTTLSLKFCRYRPSIYLHVKYVCRV